MSMGRFGHVLSSGQITDTMIQVIQQQSAFTQVLKDIRCCLILCPLTHTWAILLRASPLLPHACPRTCYHLAGTLTSSTRSCPFPCRCAFLPCLVRTCCLVTTSAALPWDELAHLLGLQHPPTPTPCQADYHGTQRPSTYRNQHKCRQNHI